MIEGRIQSERRWRLEYAITTAVIFPVGGLLYAALAALAWYHGDGDAFTLPMAFFGGGYLLFSLLSGLRVTIRLLGKCPLAVKICLTVLFIAPLYLAMLGVFYAIPYGIYNLIQVFRLRSLAEEERQVQQQIQQQSFGAEEEPW